jgi:hypothetical protein
MMFDLNIGIRVTFSYFKSGEGHHSHVLKLFSERVKKEDALVHGNTPNLKCIEEVKKQTHTKQKYVVSKQGDQMCLLKNSPKFCPAHFCKS